MNRVELIETIAQKTDLSKSQATMAVKAFEVIVAKELAQGGSVVLIGFGTFSVGERAERQARNPKTGDPITIAAAKTVKFKAGKALKEAVNG